MKISVLIPVYNVEKFVEEAIGSILNQSYKDLEIIIIDDFSTDSTPDLIQNLCAEDDRILFLRNNKNEGIVYTLNKAFKVSTGKYILRMDGDDISAYDRVEKKLQFLESNKDIALVGCSIISINILGLAIGKRKYYNESNLLLKILKYTTPVSHIWLSRREVYYTLNGYRDIPGAEDYDFLLRAITCGFNISNLTNYFGYKVRLARNGNTNSTIGLKQRKSFYYAYKLYKQRIKFGVDSYNINALNSVLELPQWRSFLFYFTNELHNKSIEFKLQGKTTKSIIYRLFSILLSPDKLKYNLEQLILRVIISYHSAL